MMGDEGKPGKKIKVKGRVKRLDRPPDNPMVDVSRTTPCLSVCFKPLNTSVVLKPSTFMYDEWGKQMTYNADKILFLLYWERS